MDEHCGGKQCEQHPVYSFVPFKMYKVDDGSGDITVLGCGDRLPTRGAHVRVRGRLNELGVFGGQSIGLHLKEEDLRVDRTSDRR